MSSNRITRRTVLGGIAFLPLGIAAACDSRPMRVAGFGNTAVADSGGADGLTHAADAGGSLDAGGGLDAGHPDAVAADAEIIDARMPDGGGTCSATSPDALGPYYRTGAPVRDGLADGEAGEPMLIWGRVLAEDCRPVSDALLDLWQADRDGDYDTTSSRFRFRARTYTDASGRFSFRTIRPGHYPLGGSMRPAHIHVQVSGRGLATLTTQIYFAGDPYLAPNDPCTSGCDSADSARIMSLVRTPMAGVDGWQGSVDLIVRVQ